MVLTWDTVKCFPVPSCAGKTAMHSQAEEKFPAGSLRQFCAASSALPSPHSKNLSLVILNNPLQALKVWYRTYVKSSAIPPQFQKRFRHTLYYFLHLYSMYLIKGYTTSVHCILHKTRSCLDVNSVSTRFFWFCYSHAASPSLNVDTMQSTCSWARARHQQLSNANAAEFLGICTSYLFWWLLVRTCPDYILDLCWRDVPMSQCMIFSIYLWTSFHTFSNCLAQSFLTRSVLMVYWVMGRGYHLGQIVPRLSHHNTCTRLCKHLQRLGHEGFFCRKMLAWDFNARCCLYLMVHDVYLALWSVPGVLLPCWVLSIGYTVYWLTSCSGTNKEVTACHRLIDIQGIFMKSNRMPATICD